MSQYRPALYLALLTALAGNAGALPGDSEQPITIRTDEAIRDETRGKTLYRGDVEFRQGSLLIRADEVTLVERARTAARPGSRDPLAGTGVLNIEARGAPAYLTQQFTAEGEPVQARARVVEYFQPRALVRLRNAARIRQGNMTLHAAQVDYYIDKQVIRAFSNPATGRRVTTSIPPERLPGD
ncbi:lipopolysaccharide transport periplasmic protein LptA [Pseudohaliea rubra]|uniref:LptA, protein essential for LPS transport across the periplasm n=1 Tax=Pseudohaliea rubra DSM 19751 TaxID=1265313 RepID=A0A095VS96_9GAMM|nr:lipopolysaccharide transport periplasmic protein LptA [Pseudohaliea rubra]KGE03963.1 LptA, protein essential for LPS transport across the periplasm [Pseudohaliea rubra DSM 19751]